MNEQEFHKGTPTKGPEIAGVASAEEPLTEEMSALEAEAGPHREDILLALRQELAALTDWRDRATNELVSLRTKAAELYTVLTRQQLMPEHNEVTTGDLLQNLIDGGRQLLNQTEQQNVSHRQNATRAKAKSRQIAQRSDRMIRLLAEVLLIYTSSDEAPAPGNVAPAPPPPDEGRVTPP